LLAKAEREGRLRESIRLFLRASLLIVDEIGYQPVEAEGAVDAAWWTSADRILLPQTIRRALSHLPSKGSFAGKPGSATSSISLTTTLADESV
jgi:hypothetical protein